jgi:MipA family protein
MSVPRKAACLLLMAAVSVAHADGAGPYVDMGIGGIGLYLPDYRGAEDSHVRGYPFPYLVYRSERVRVARDGVRASLFTHTDVTLSLSMAASLPGSSSSAARAGMPGLMPTFEAGPSIDIRLAGRRYGTYYTQIRLPMRTVLASNLRQFETVGWLFHPHLRHDWRMRAGSWWVGSNIGAGPLWATRLYHDYFYGVDAQYEIPGQRPAYEASGGYSGFRVGLSSVVQKNRVRYGTFVSYDWLDGVAFRDSPLLVRDDSVLFGLYMSYSLWSSHRTGVPDTGN